MISMILANHLLMQLWFIIYYNPQLPHDKEQNHRWQEFFYSIIIDHDI